jgi:membrane dipeptidase
MLVFRDGAPGLDAKAVHAAAPVADLHVHPSLNAYYLRRDLGRRHRAPRRWNPIFTQQLDLPRARQGGLRLLTNCAYAPSVLMVAPFRAAIGSFEAIEALCARNPDVAEVARRGEVERIVASGKLAVIHAAEGGHHLERSLSRLDELAARGLRYLTLTHFVHNGLAQPAELPVFRYLRGKPGLTELGRAVVKRCEELSVLVDVTHCSDKSFADVLGMVTKPVIATHTGFRRFAPVERAMTDEQLREIARTGGMVGVITWDYLLGGKRAAVDAMADAIVHGALVAGPAHVGIGTDFDGWVHSAAGIRDATAYPQLTERLARRGFSEPELRGILGGNYLRVLGEAV